MNPYYENEATLDGRYSVKKRHNKMMRALEAVRPGWAELELEKGRYLSVSESNPRRIAYGKSVDEVFNNDTRQSTKLGKYLKSVLGVDELDHVLAKDVEAVMLKFIPQAPNYIFKIVEGSDITKYYHYRMSEGEDGSLGGSCMRNSSCSDYFGIYEKSCKMLIYMNENTKKIRGRALLWSEVFFKELDKSICFMDRVYSKDHVTEQLFFKYANDNDLVRKAAQSYSEKMDFFYEGSEWREEIAISYKGCVDDSRPYPYMDTMSFAGDDIMSNVPTAKTTRNLVSTSGYSSDTMQCYNCDRNVPINKIRNDNGRFICTKCLTKTFECETCGAETSKKECKTFHGLDYCPTCFVNVASTCSHCACDYPSDYIPVVLISDILKPVCKGCLNRYYTLCECGAYHLKEQNCSSIIVEPEGTNPFDATTSAVITEEYTHVWSTNPFDAATSGVIAEEFTHVRSTDAFDATATTTTA